MNFSVNITLPKKMPKRVIRRKETITPVFRESIITQPSVSQKKEKTISESSVPKSVETDIEQ